MIKLFIVDDHTIFREGLRALLELEPDFTVIGEASRGEEAVALVADDNPQSEAERGETPDVILLDLHLPDGSGSSFCLRLRRACPEAKVLILSAYDDDQEVTAALIAGASGYVLKTVNGASAVKMGLVSDREILTDS
jgi:DNA-binding NarL/FixJ family response regulator